jgi:hypothetical protein
LLPFVNIIDKGEHMDSDNTEKRPTIPRLSVNLTHEEQERMQTLIPWGIQSAIVRTLINGMLNLIEEYGEVAIAMLLTGKVGIIDIVRTIERRHKDGADGPKT